VKPSDLVPKNNTVLTQQLNTPVAPMMSIARPCGATLFTRKESEKPMESVAKPRINKYVLIGLIFLYIISPIDLIPDVIPIAGFGDDLGALAFGLRAMFSKA
jgi:Protein of unknown function (DUF1232)